MNLSRNVDVVVTIGLSVAIVLVLPASDWPLGRRLEAFAAIILGVPTLVCAARIALSRPARANGDSGGLSPGARPR